MYCIYRYRTARHVLYILVATGHYCYSDFRPFSENYMYYTYLTMLVFNGWKRLKQAVLNKWDVTAYK